jgi:GAF domain-containing protein/HAMP domain-containing protein
MTQSNLMQPESEYQAEPGDSEKRRVDEQVKRNAIWGAVLLTVTSLAFFGYAVTTVNFLDWEDYVLVGFPLLFATLNVANIFLIQRGRTALGSGIVFVLNLILPILLTIIVSDTFGAAFYYVTVSSALFIWQALPRQSRQWSIITACAALAIIGVTNLIDLPNRFKIPPQLNLFVVAILVILTVGFVLFAARQAWKRNNIRSRFLTFSLGLTFIAAASVATISVSSLLSAGQQAQETSAQTLRSQVQETLIYQTIEIANQNDLILQGATLDARNVADQTAYIIDHSAAFNAEPLWKADERMFFGPAGQYINGDGDVSTVYVPNTIEIDEDFKRRLELFAFLDMAFVPVYESTPNSVAIYFVGSEEISWYYPNINLGALLPPDYLATQDIFYTSGAPEMNPGRQVVWTPVYDDPGGQGLLVSAIAPVYTTGNSFMGVIGIDISLAGLTEAIENADLTTGGYAFLLDSDGRALALPEQGYRDFYGREREFGELGSNFLSFARSEFSPLITEMLDGKTGFQSIFVDDQELFVAYTTIASTGWHIASVVKAEQVLAPALALQTELERQTSSLVFQRIVPVGVAIIVLVVVAGIFFTNRLVKPIERLTEGAAKIGAGDWDTPLPESELSEISGLSHTLRTMAAQLRGMLESLERRVAERTSSLELAAQVGRTISQVSDLDNMLKQATQLILKQFDLYYVQVYLTDSGQTMLKLESGTGDVGVQLLARGHSLPVSTASINGRAAVEKRTIVISDTSDSLTFRPNPLLPETRGEMALPLIVGEKVVGVLDLQTRFPGKLTEEMVPTYEALAGQLAVAVQNANLLSEAEKSRAEVEAQVRRQVRAGWNDHLDAIHKPEQIGFVFDRGQVVPLDQVSELADEDQAVSAPISLTGEELGSLVVEIDEARREQTSALITVVARQVAQQIENLRLLESAERYRRDAELAARRQTQEGWQEYVRTKAGEGLSYLYDLNEVRPYNNGQDDASALTFPLKVRDETVGKVAIEGLTQEDKEALELVGAVVERLGTHIESLRLTQQIQLRAHREQALRQITSAVRSSTNLTTIMRTAVRELGTVMGRRAVIRMAGSEKPNDENTLPAENRSSENADGGMNL